MPRSIRALFALLSLLILTGTVVATTPTPSAFAGTNGQQLQINYQTTISSSCGPLIASRITVQGTNQNGSSSTWSTTVSNMVCGIKQVTTTGWWWKGPVTVTITYSNKATRTFLFNVPTVSTSNFYTVLAK